MASVSPPEDLLAVSVGNPQQLHNTMFQHCSSWLKKLTIIIYQPTEIFELNLCLHSLSITITQTKVLNVIYICLFGQAKIKTIVFQECQTLSVTLKIFIALINSAKNDLSNMYLAVPVRGAGARLHTLPGVRQSRRQRRPQHSEQKRLVVVNQVSHLWYSEVFNNKALQ